MLVDNDSDCDTDVLIESDVIILSMSKLSSDKLSDIPWLVTTEADVLADSDALVDADSEADVLADSDALVKQRKDKQCNDTHQRNLERLRQRGE